MRISSGIEDNWNMGTDQILEGTVRRIPIVDTGGITCWDGATGWRAAIEWMQDANVFRWIFDQNDLPTFQTMYLIEPSEEPSQFLESGYRTRGLTLKMRSSDDTPITGY